MNLHDRPGRDKWNEIQARPIADLDELYGKVQFILDDIRRRKDEALRDFTLKFDRVRLDTFAVSEDEADQAAQKVDPELKKAILLASENISRFHEAQKNRYEKIMVTPGVECWQKAVPIEKVGLYIPGGTAPLFSTVLMLAIPAKIAGCNEIVLCSPPDLSGNIHPAILYAAKISGVTRIFKLGGVQAIGAMAFGTSSIPRVYKIFGPGNQYVMAAKQLVALNDVAVDLPAGPSEVLVLADDSANPVFVAADLLSQAEHGADSQVILVTGNRQFAEQVKNETDRQLLDLPRKNFAAKALNNSRIVILENEKDQIDFINAYAPEHLIISTKNHMETAEKITSAGSVFLGNMTPESAGDYASGTNHTLPTNGWARSYSGVNLDSFRKKITFQKITSEGLERIGPAIEIMAEAEKLDAHRNAVSLRLLSLNK